MIGEKKLRVGLLMLVLLGTAWAVHAEVYKWVDADGKIQYGDDPPKGAKVQKVGGGVTVVPAARFTGSESSSSRAASGQDSSADSRRSAEQQASAAAASSAAEARRKAVERCEKNRGIDCQDETDSQTVLPNGEVYRPMPGWSQPPIRPSGVHQSSQATSSVASRKAYSRVPDASQSGTRK